MSQRRAVKKSGKSKFLTDLHHDQNHEKPTSRAVLPISFMKVVTVIVVIIAAIMGYKGYIETRVNTPFSTEKLTELSMINKRQNYWGSYRPGVYFGMKTREPHSLVTGLMWHFPPVLAADYRNLRHWCEQENQLQTYGWLKHDGKNFGIQKIMDNGIQLITTFVKKVHGDKGGDWTAKIDASVVKKSPDNDIISLLYYTALEDKSNGYIHPIMDRANKTMIGVRGETSGLGGFNLFFRPSGKENVKISHLVTYAPNLSVLKETVMENLNFNPYSTRNEEHVLLKGENLIISVNGEKLRMKPNFIVTQVTATLPLDLQIIFESDSIENRSERLVEKVYNKALNQFETAFDEKFESTFSLSKKGYSKQEIDFAKSAFSNLLGSVGYFYGSSQVKSHHTNGPVPYWQAPLYSGVPSRSFFPRGFLWDEGFHGLLISSWDLDIEVDIINHWFDLMNSEGWIPREMILGDEALAKVPQEFVTQDNSNANPPTFFLTLDFILRHRREEFLSKHLLLLDKLYPRLQVWFEWFNTTQKGEISSTYRWRGRDSQTKRELNPKTLTSGLDDYPRASHPDSKERHIDLRCWMALAANVMSDLAGILHKKNNHYRDTHQYLSDNNLLNALHWSNNAQIYADYGLHTDEVQLRTQRPSTRAPQIPLEVFRVVLKKPEYRFIDSSFGYVSLFPFILKLIDAHSLQLGKILENLERPELLWTNFGLRSLATNSPFYSKYNTEHDPPYWRGPVWINLNYITIAALHHYSYIDGPYQSQAKQIYGKLRNVVIKNIYKQYKKSGYVWENYNDSTGSGKGSHPFTGWTSLIVLLMAEIY